ncbi:type I-E CRISPR-associated protein Cse1/CasA [Salinactinospora qingdaonensis]|uniref:Type I-E CRISPR-associated protein Cse1/CasA n=2 Tax=Salinactinospora qingdaonensis TaxID=702744 RepID=A0ABP7G692_9ACTN
MSGASFDLRRQGFCPVGWLPGQDLPQGKKPDDLLSLEELLVHAHAIAGVRVPLPPAEAGLLRILAVLVARVTGLDRIEDKTVWAEKREEVLRDGCFDPHRVAEYFDGFAQRFELFHTATQRPFLQQPDLVEQCQNSKGELVSSGVNKLVTGRSAGQSFVWQSHTVDSAPVPVGPPEAFFSMLVWLFYGMPGRCTSRKVGQTSAADTKAGPLRGTVSFHPVGASLFETLLLGLPHLPSDADDLAPWEEPQLPDPLGVPPQPRGLARVLTGRFRHAVLLAPAADGSAVEDTYITWAWRREQGPAKDPYLIHFPRPGAENPLSPQAAQADRAIWRDLDTLLRKTLGEERFRPQVFDDLDEFREGDVAIDVDTVGIRAIGFDQDRSQARNRQYYTGTTPPVLGMLETRSGERWYRVRRARQNAERAGENLRTALRGAWRELTRTSGRGRQRDEGVAWLHPGMARYWSVAEWQFWTIVRPEEPPQGGIGNRFIHHALNTYDQVTKDYARSGHDIKILERHRSVILRGWRSS